MTRDLRAFAMAAPLLVAVAAEPAPAQKSGGNLKMFSPDSPASMSIHEEATFVAEGPMMGVFAKSVCACQASECASSVARRWQPFSLCIGPLPR